MAKLPIVVSPQTVNGGTKPQEFLDRVDAGWGGGWFMYTSGSLSWTSAIGQMVNQRPTGYPILASPKQTDPTSTNTFMQNLTQPWRSKLIAAYYQEPEDDHTTDAQRAQFRQQVVTLGNLVRPWGARNGVHLQEWGLNPTFEYYQHTWKFVDGIEDDIDYVAWSLLGNVGTSLSLWKQKADRIANYMDTYLPGKPWGVGSGGIPVNITEPQGGAARQARAQMVIDVVQYVVSLGGTMYGWFDWNDYNGNGKDQRADADPLLLDALRTVAQIEVTDPGTTPPPPPPEPAPVIVLDEGFEGAASGTVISAANTDFSLVSAGASQIARFSNTRAVEGVQSAHFVAAAQSGSYGAETATSTSKFVRLYYFPVTHPNPNVVLIYTSDTSNNRAWQIVANPDGSVKLQNSGGAAIGGNTAPLPVNQWSRIDVSQVGSTVTLEVYPGEAQRNALPGTAAGVNVQSGTIAQPANQRMWIGPRASTTAEFYIDAVVISTDRLAPPLGTPTSPPPTTGQYVMEWYWDDGERWHRLTPA